MRSTVALIALSAAVGLPATGAADPGAHAARSCSSPDSTIYHLRTAHIGCAVGRRVAADYAARPDECATGGDASGSATRSCTVDGSYRCDSTHYGSTEASKVRCSSGGSRVRFTFAY
jgi:hypothetical protein